jgi:hypothetical protein
VVAVGGRPRCANAAVAACNWLADAPGELCACCVLTRTRPADDDPAGLERFAIAEAAKRRLLFELGELALPTQGLSFDLLSARDGPVTTGHADGVVTLDLAEADAASREQRRTELDEPYRTVLGHLRHEVGHFYFTVLVPDGPVRARASALFGDERADYQEALDRHYRMGPPADWAERFVSAYATMHPAEDWAETFAHYLHIRDALQTAASYGVMVAGPDAVPLPQLEADPPAEPDSFAEIVAHWLPLTYALNAINRSMGHDDLYPFVLSPVVMDKLALVHELVAEN